MEEIASKRKERSRGTRYHGLINQGATCYLNSVLQVLFMTKEFRRAVKGSSVNCEYIDPLLEDLFTVLENSTANTSGITEKLDIKVNEQCDAAEYFERILRHTSCEASQIFQGELTHKNTCSNCKSVTNTSDPFWNLPLILETDKKDYNVEKGIKGLFQQLCIGGENQMYCEGCNAKADAKIIMEMTHHPKVLTLLLKRFKFDYRNQEYVKIKRTVTVPHTLQIPKNQTYELYAFVEHFGNLRSGHYIATIKSHEDDEWYKFNDRSVTPLQRQPVNNERSSSAYLLFYRKKKMHAAETGKTDEGEATDHNHVYKQKNSEKRIPNDREDKDGETGSAKREKKKKKDSIKSKIEGVELRDDKSDAQITQKRNDDDNKESEQGIDKKSRSGCPKQMTQSSHNYHKNDAEDQQDEILDLKPPKYNEQHGLKGEQDKRIRLDKQRDVKNLMTNVMIDDEADRSKTAGGKVEQNLSENNKDQKKEEKKGKEHGEQAQRREETKPQHGQGWEDKDSWLLDDDSQNRLQQNKELCVKRQIIKDIKEGENTYAGKTEQCCVPPGLSGSTELTENQRRNTGSEQMKPCDPSKQEVIQSDNKPCSVVDMSRGISLVNEPQTKTQKRAGKKKNKDKRIKNKKKSKCKIGCLSFMRNNGQSSDSESK